ncbi:hypothetical protein D9Q98_004136 [Chlorella vulgaris]|uniref:Cell cycle checkpoint control protein RAD9A n=1 Tax=Chlorella vulgaris TaxID=3077 RepID=A0A9D4TRH2_CHLVU|nr:hypothetical protein D9Q98_004136 [Chlorella vulgaris]
MSVRFTLVDRQLKLLKHGLQSLQKIGNELLLEALPARIVLRTINSSLSAYLSVTYNADFFDSYDVLDCTVVQAGLLMKHVLSVFRTQKVSKILFDLNTASCKATITLHCENGLVKSFKLPTMDSEILQATVDKQQFAVRLTAETAAISRLLSSFHAGLEEVTIVALPDGIDRPVHVNSFIDPQKGHVDKSLYTSVQVEPTETFLSYVNSADEATDVTVNLKDFKAMLSLCENLGTHIKLCFDSPGNPLVAEPHFPHAHGQDVDYEAELILSTLLESHGGPAAEAAAAGARAAAAGLWAAPGGGDLRTPGGAGIYQVDSPGGTNVPTVLNGGGGVVGRTSGRSAELGLSPALAMAGRSFPGATVARPSSAAAGQSRFARDELRQQQGQDPAPAPGQQQQQVQQVQQQQQQRSRPSGLIDDGSAWRTTTTAGGGQQQQPVGLNPLGGDAGPLPEVSWDDEEMPDREEAVPEAIPDAVPSSPPMDPLPTSTLAPGAMM